MVSGPSKITEDHDVVKHMKIRWKQPLFYNSYQLNTFEWDGFQGTKQEKKLFKCLVKASPELEDAKIKCSRLGMSERRLKTLRKSMQKELGKLASKPSLKILIE